MRWPIRNQILLPFLMIQIGTVFVVAISSAWFAVRQVDQEIIARMENVLSTLETATYPMTPAILEQLKQFSEADFVVFNQNDEVSGTTLVEMASNEHRLSAKSLTPYDRNSLEQRTLFEFQGRRYFAGLISKRSGVRTESVLVLYPESEWAVERWQAIFPPVFIGGLLLILTIFASLWISQRIARRIQTVQHQVARLAGGNYSASPKPAINDELQDLAEDLNQLSVVLDQSMKSVRSNERSSMLAQLSGGLAHQLRNSLTGARVSIQLHQRRCATGNDEAIAVAIRQLTLTEEQIKALLRLTRGESDKPESDQLDQILNDVISLVQPMCEHHKTRFTSDRLEIDQEIRDANALRGALLNLLLNAIEAAGPGGEVSVSTGVDSGFALIEISDNGPGVPEELTEEIFHPFVTTKKEGVGLGLALARQAAQDCEGSLTLIQNGRTRFQLKIPL
ncbi:HAMP domain-containing sensor histidine kinase [Rubinisphaera sp.]|uniref:sensor histidine kinase n=1 Tax=Rubinisphaera sp. TaxID=2024857 RepID=UPI0025F1D8F8|nr:HAMP domain-containing sensor histidine kinase [Rubinisphaera sp.]